MKIIKSIPKYIIWCLLVFFLGCSIWVAFFPQRTDYNKVVRSSSLQIKTEKDGCVTVTTYKDDNGMTCFAADLMYACVRRTKGNNNVLEEYFDDNGNPAKQYYGHYALLIEYDDKRLNMKYSYLDEQGAPMVTTMGFSTIIRTFDEKGNILTEKYYDLNGNPIETNNSAYGQERIYDKNGDNTIVRYLGSDGSLKSTKEGYAIIKNKCYDRGGIKGLPEFQFYYDENECPKALDHSEYGVHLEYDEYGRITEITYLDKLGEPLLTPEGFSTVKKTYYNDDSIQMELYYDKDDKPVALSHGEYGVLHENDQVVYLDKDGGKIFSLKLLLHNQPWLVMMSALMIIVFSLLCGKKGNLCLLILCLGAIFFMTIIFRAQTVSRSIIEPLFSYRKFFENYTIRKDIVDNIWLFVPLGAVSIRLIYIMKVRLNIRNGLLLILLFSLLSCFVEFLQYVLHVGTFEVDDIISNTLGGMIGVSAGVTCVLIQKKVRWIK